MMILFYKTILSKSSYLVVVSKYYLKVYVCIGYNIIYFRVASVAYVFIAT